MTRTRWRRALLATVASVAVATGPVLVAAGPAQAADDPPETEVVAWGAATLDSIGNPPNTALTIPMSIQQRSIAQVAAGGQKVMALDSTGTIRQWGNVDAADELVPQLEAAWIGWGSGSGARLAIGTDGTPALWALDGLCCDEVAANNGPVTNLALGDGVAAAVRPDGTVVMLNDGDAPTQMQAARQELVDALPAELTDPATAHVKQIALDGWGGYGYAIAVRTDGSLTTFKRAGALSPELRIPADLGPVKSITLRGSNAFAITQDGAFRQWTVAGAGNLVDECTPGNVCTHYHLPMEPGDQLAEISVSETGILGRTTDNRLIIGEYQQLSAEGSNTNDRAKHMAESAPLDKLNGRKIVSIASNRYTHFVVTAAPDPISVETEATATGTTGIGPNVAGAPLALTGTPATFSDPAAEVSNQWLADGAPIEGATGTTLTKTRDLAGKKISFRSTVTVDGQDVSSTSDQIGPLVDVHLVSPSRISGVAKVGETLTAHPAQINVDGVTPLKFWVVNGSPQVSVDDTYEVKEANEGATIVFRTWFLNAQGVTIDSYSDPVGPVVWEEGDDPMSLNTPASLSGTAKVGQKLTGTQATFNGAPESVTNQWLADGVVIDGETGTEYTPVDGDEYKQITFRSTATRGDETLSSTSNPTVPVQPGVLVTVDTEASVSGTAKVGETLTGTPATFSPDGVEVTNQWLADGEPIGGATGNTFSPTAAQVGAKISFQSTGTLEDTSVVSTSDETAAVADVDLEVVSAPSISGTAQVTQTLTGTPGTFNAGAVTSQWLADGAPIDGATGTTLTLTEELEGASITFRSTATRGDDTLNATSTAVGPVLPEHLPITIVEESSITGTAQVGIALTGVPAVFDGDGSVTYQWLVDGDPIAGATGTTYTPVAGDEGKFISFRTTADNGDIELPSTSEAVGPVLPAAEDPDEEPGDEGKDKIKVLPDATFLIGETIQVEVGEDWVGENVGVWLFSTPFPLGTYTVAGNGQITLTIPSNAPTGQHRLAVYDSNGDLIGWQNVTVLSLPGGPGGPFTGVPGGQLPKAGFEGPSYMAPLGIVLVLAGMTLMLARTRREPGGDDTELA